MKKGAFAPSCFFHSRFGWTGEPLFPLPFWLDGRNWIQKNKPIPDDLLLFVEKIQDYRETALDTDSLEELRKIKYQAKLVLEILDKLYELHKI